MDSPFLANLLKGRQSIKGFFVNVTLIPKGVTNVAVPLKEGSPQSDDTIWRIQRVLISIPRRTSIDKDLVIYTFLWV